MRSRAEHPRRERGTKQSGRDGTEDHRTQKRAAKHTEGTNDRREKHRHGPNTGRQLRTSPHTHTSSQCRQSAGERIRPSTQQTHTPPAVIHQWTRRNDTPPSSPPVQSHGQRNTATAKTQRTPSEQSPKEPHAEAIPHPPTTRRLTPRGHAERTVSPIEPIRRPSLKNASVSDGP
ncbi:hypothetical protein TCDM_10238 [Trypanosoma cruzi Dm28c]|uniref:Uncharacterized protein n=1 Tax=Trypanosoma cruzi Dm28c TaxID=1416333 RepID=V5D3V7_TRYCR|nr:hypothetical protein TCDM_10238 [Trypanosoma cruzi Dm28c]